MATWKPQIVVGIDFGMTCTGVAYSKGPDFEELRAIQRWPGTFGSTLVNKVKTAVCYDLSSGDLATWGFQCDPNDESLEFNELFKLYLDPMYRDNDETAPTLAEAQKWFCDYLRSLYKYIVKHLDETTKHFWDNNVEFVFSIPTTWKHPATQAKIEALIKSAGFGKSTNHRASITLTEAEAAAVCASKQQMHRDEVFLVCDAGGGTTDLNVLKVTSAARQQTQLEPLSSNEGRAIGSTLIDYKVRKKLEDRLRLVQSHLSGEVEEVVHKMMQDRYESFKCNLGGEGMNVRKLPLPIPDFPPGRDYPHAGIEDSKLILMRQELEEIFDEQIQVIIDLIDEQLRLVQKSHPSDNMSRLILSGGLGSSPYVRAKIKERYQGSTAGLFPNAQDMSVILAEEPQLAVVKGLVLARTQPLKNGPEVLPCRRCPLSYGILCRQLYDPGKCPWHIGATVVKDPFDKKRWVEDQIFWFIKQGHVVAKDSGQFHRFRYKIRLGNENKPWQTRIVMSALPSDQLPYAMKPNNGVTLVCKVESTLTRHDMRLKNHKWYHLKREHYLAEFDIKMIVGTGLKFEIWGRDDSGGNAIRSKAHDDIIVAWEAPDDPSIGKAPIIETAEIFPS